MKTIPVIVGYSLIIVFSFYFSQFELPTLYPMTSYALASDQNQVGYDKFGTREIYPTKEDGREWYVNMNNPMDDENFSITFGPNITSQEDGSWRISAPVVRMNVKTIEGETKWKNVEMTGYAKIHSVIQNSSNKVIENDLTWYARGGKHNQEIPCEATAYMGGLYDTGKVGWKKELWFVGGYTDERHANKVTTPLMDRWIGWKIVMYNINNNSEVKLDHILIIQIPTIGSRSPILLMMAAGTQKCPIQIFLLLTVPKTRTLLLQTLDQRQHSDRIT